ncbi:MAG: hypothetical protein R2704_02235 [Microthrixaceae bacterium]
MYLRCVELGADSLGIEDEAEARDLIQRASALGANALTAAGTGAIPGAIREAAAQAGLTVVDADDGERPSSHTRRSAWVTRPVTPWPVGPPGVASRRLARRHRCRPNALDWVRSDRPSSVSVPSNVVATVRRMAGRPGRGFSAPWPEHPGDPAWASFTVLPEPPPSRLPPGRGFAVNLWLCGRPAPATSDVRVVAVARWGDRAHSWAFTGPPPAGEVGTIATLPLVRPLEDPLVLELSLDVDPESDSPITPPARYRLSDDSAGVPFWLLLTPEE